ncbi:MAG TPA: hypothetical protein PKY05_06445 [Fibrobacteria bacterium]|nr:hypothetical protein [Fibrobacteria bacterium]
MLLTLSLLKGLAMSGVLHEVPLESIVQRSQAIYVARPTSRKGFRKVEGMAEPCTVPWTEYQVEEVIRGEGSVAKGSLIQVEPADARFNCSVAKDMNSPVHPILIVDRFIPLDPQGLVDPAKERVIFLATSNGSEMVEAVGGGVDGLAALERIRNVVAQSAKTNSTGGTKSVPHP